MKTINYNDWRLDITSDTTIVITKLGESREYRVATIVDVNQNEDMNEYVYLTHSDKAYTQVKFEDEDGLIIDLFDKKGSHLMEIGAHIFGEQENPMCKVYTDSEALPNEDESCSLCGGDCVNQFVPTDEELKRFRKEWGQDHLEICCCLGFDPDDDEGSSQDVIDTGNYFWDNEKDIWLNKCASGFQGKDQDIADYIRHNQ